MKFQGSNVLVMMNQMGDKVMTKDILIPHTRKNLCCVTKKITINFAPSIHTFPGVLLK